MYPLNFDSVGMIPLEQVIHESDQLYLQVNDITKIKLKCWLYYGQSRASGGKLSLPFDTYDSHMRAIDYLEMVRGFCVDVSDLGGLENSTIIICQWYGI
jgi:hypothetical protein